MNTIHSDGGDTNELSPRAAALEYQRKVSEEAYEQSRAPRAKARYLIGFLVLFLLLGTAFNMVVSVLIPQRLKDIHVADPTGALSMINGSGSILSIFLGVFIGQFSDRTRSRIGRRSPWILWGSVVWTVCLLIMSQQKTAFGIGLMYNLMIFGFGSINMPAMTILSDRIDTSFRGTASAVIGGTGVAAQGLGQLVGGGLINNITVAFFIAAVAAILSGIVPLLILPKEHESRSMPRDGMPLWRVILESFRPPIKGAGDFWKAFVCRTCLIVAYQMITSYQLYILQDHIGLSKNDSAHSIAVMAMITMIVSFIASLSSGVISDVIKRRKVIIVVACALYAVGIAMPWAIPSAMGMYLFAGIAGFGYGVYSAVDQALNVDVLPNKKDAGKDLGILNIATCAGQAIGSLVTATTVRVSGGYTLVFPLAIVIAIVAGFVIVTVKRVR